MNVQCPVIPAGAVFIEPVVVLTSIIAEVQPAENHKLAAGLTEGHIKIAAVNLAFIRKVFKIFERPSVCVIVVSVALDLKNDRFFRILLEKVLHVADHRLELEIVFVSVLAVDRAVAHIQFVIFSVNTQVEITDAAVEQLIKIQILCLGEVGHSPCDFCSRGIVCAGNADFVERLVIGETAHPVTACNLVGFLRRGCGEVDSGSCHRDNCCCCCCKCLCDLGCYFHKFLLLFVFVFVL